MGAIFAERSAFAAVKYEICLIKPSDHRVISLLNTSLRYNIKTFVLTFPTSKNSIFTAKGANSFIIEHYKTFAWAFHLARGIGLC
ncbi:hypothetical protein DRF67_16865 [Chryseobacterium pennipullorum]|uniref:Uncharacterized protein n=1 Tax=Chryseobacterium pennipullorum TaxID=2258963 RepID=A0A3D9AU34_9FLAO|nr:hypothetical protein DRF67_16865 [Chryseobacterium pennipullorum]